MPLRAYLSPWQEEVDADGFTTFYPRIGYPGGYLMTNRIRWTAMDLRTAEEQLQVPAQGWALVWTNVVPKDHNQVMKVADTHEVTAGTTVPEIRAIIGDEATDEVLEGSTIEQLKQYFFNCHKGRVNRWKGRV